MLTGTLDDFTLPDVLRLIAAARRTGGLVVARDGGAGDLYFRDGIVSRAVPRYERRSEAPSPDRAVEDLTFDLMRWDRGDFTWTPGAPPPGPEASVGVDELLDGVSRRLDELAEIQTLVPSGEAVPAMAPQPPEGAVQINIAPAEWRVLVLVDGSRTVHEIAGAAGLEDLEAMKLLYGLAAAGLVTAGKHEAAPPQEVSDAPPEEDCGSPAARLHEDPFLAEIDVEPVSPFEEAPEAPAVDRSTAARELAGLFDEIAPAPGFERMTASAPPAPPGVPRRVEDDDQVTRGLISRLIDGVKGL